MNLYEVSETISQLLKLRKVLSNEPQPFLVWQSQGGDASPLRYRTFKEVARLVNVLFITREELGKSFNHDPTDPTIDEVLEDHVKQLLPLATEDVEFRCIMVLFSDGSMRIWTNNGVQFNVYPMWRNRPRPDGKTPDDTGFVPAFLGAFTLNYLRTLDAREAALYGAVAASYAAQQFGLPDRSIKDGREVWNGDVVAERLEEYRTISLGAYFASENDVLPPIHGGSPVRIKSLREKVAEKFKLNRQQRRRSKEHSSRRRRQSKVIGDEKPRSNEHAENGKARPTRGRSQNRRSNGEIASSDGLDRGSNGQNTGSKGQGPPSNGEALGGD